MTGVWYEHPQGRALAEMRAPLQPKGGTVTWPMSSLTEQMADVLSPLGTEEQQRAVAAAVAHLGGGRLRIYGVELLVEKSRPAPPARLIDVLVARLDEYTVHEVLVDGDGAILEVRDRPDLVPPFSPEERMEAIALARGHPELAELVERWGVAPALFYPPPSDHREHEEARRRRVGVHFLDVHDLAAVVPLASVVLDLTARAVESLQRYQPDERPD